MNCDMHQDILDNNMLPTMWKQSPSHKLRLFVLWFQDNSTSPLNWSARSLSLNLVEHWSVVCMLDSRWPSWLSSSTYNLLNRNPPGTLLMLCMLILCIPVSVISLSSPFPRSLLSFFYVSPLHETVRSLKHNSTCISISSYRPIGDDVIYLMREGCCAYTRRVRNVYLRNAVDCTLAYDTRFSVFESRRSSEKVAFKSGGSRWHVTLDTSWRGGGGWHCGVRAALKTRVGCLDRVTYLWTRTSSERWGGRGCYAGFLRCAHNLSEDSILPKTFDARGQLGAAHTDEGQGEGAGSKVTSAILLGNIFSRSCTLGGDWCATCQFRKHRTSTNLASDEATLGASPDTGKREPPLPTRRQGGLQQATRISGITVWQAASLCVVTPTRMEDPRSLCRSPQPRISKIASELNARWDKPSYSQALIRLSRVQSTLASLAEKNLIATTVDKAIAAGIINFHNKHAWAQENSHTVEEAKHQHRFSINVWAGIIGDRLIGPYLLPNRLNSAMYHDFIANELPVSLEDMPYLQRQNMWFIHDGLLAHFPQISP
ncbi:hypothetical protein PR048_030651 [Dryococelus australis]|uniref:Uncharacterized protein n=1 Tax=Dryococelus australis TaxID=614101 RepID=A0ABQ9G9I2_9NEOP|nr:hypothetical protein PR048_030651 [Dryococelus australis]